MWPRARAEISIRSTASSWPTTALETSSRARASSSLSRSAACSSGMRSGVSVSTSAIVNLSLTEEEGQDSTEGEERPEGDRVLACRGAAGGQDVEGDDE